MVSRTFLFSRKYPITKFESIANFQKYQILIFCNFFLSFFYFFQSKIIYCVSAKLLTMLTCVHKVNDYANTVSV